MRSKKNTLSSLYILSSVVGLDCTCLRKLGLVGCILSTPCRGGVEEKDENYLGVLSTGIGKPMDKEFPCTFKHSDL